MQESSYYRLIDAYEKVHQDDCGGVCDFLDWALAHHGQSTERSFLELGCGPAGYARELARRGFRSVGLDLSPGMVDHARAAAGREGLAVEILLADMSDFTLSRPVALAAVVLDTACHLITNEQMIAFLRSAARNLLPGGILVLDMAHPGRGLFPTSGPNLQRVTDGSREIESLFGLPDDPYDWLTQTWQITTRLTVREHGAIVAEATDRMPLRYYLLQELRLLMELAGVFEAPHWYRGMELPAQPFSGNPPDGRMVMIARKPAG
jgi:SAM-dependent methyltransferase